MKNHLPNNSIATIILAAGQGTRMKSNVTKVLHQLGGKFLLQHVIDAALPLTESISVVVGHNSESVKNVIIIILIGYFKKTNLELDMLLKKRYQALQITLFVLFFMAMSHSFRLTH